MQGQNWFHNNRPKKLIHKFMNVRKKHNFTICLLKKILSTLKHHHKGTTQRVMEIVSTLKYHYKITIKKSDIKFFSTLTPKKFDKTTAKSSIFFPCNI